ncbi:TPA: hypothetical protein KD869_002826 [Vibrio parahaemolyticus]|nr:hypothetical protein [Vibrio parahaemolyticus]HBC3949081.1 hypothetical protein [Vibrio parahaemolyticus]
MNASVKYLFLISTFILWGCGPEDNDETYIPKAYCGVVKNGDEYTVNHHPYSLVNSDDGRDISDEYCTAHMFKIYKYVDGQLTLSTEIRIGESNDLNDYIQLAVEYGYQSGDVNNFSLQGEAVADFSNQDEFGWSSVENNIVLETAIGDKELYQSVTLDEQGALIYRYHSSDEQEGEFAISTDDALLFFYGGESVSDAMNDIEYFSSLF